MRLKLTQATVNTIALAKGKTDQLIGDTELDGFYLRLRTGAEGVRKSYLIQRRVHGRQRRLEVGPLTLPLAEARTKARKLLARFTLGHDPVAEKAAKRAHALRTFSAAADLYLQAKGHLRPSTLRSSRLYLTGAYFRTLHPVPLSEISRADIAARLSALAREQPATAIAARSMISRLFAWAIAEGWVDSNPASGLANLPPPTSRDRVLTDSELVAIWRACEDDDFGRIVRLLILTATRRQEIGSLRWDEYDPATGVWTLPAARAKNRQPHRVPLPSAARNILDALPRRDSGFVFGKRAVGFTAWSEPKRLFDQRLGDAVAPWTLHDLRRTVATRLGDLGIEPHVIEAALGHYSGFRKGVAGTYNRSRYEGDVARALAAWAEHVTAIVEGRNPKIVPLSFRRVALRD